MKANLSPINYNISDFLKYYYLGTLLKLYIPDKKQ